MQISKINTNTSFNGLWEKQTKMVGKHTEERCPVYVSKYTYHPFKNESPKEIEQAVASVKTGAIWECWDKYGDPWGPEKMYITEASIGEKLNITSGEYEKIKNMKDVGHPVSDSLNVECIKSDRYNLGNIVDYIE